MNLTRLRTWIGRHAVLALVLAMAATLSLVAAAVILMVHQYSPAMLARPLVPLLAVVGTFLAVLGFTAALGCLLERSGLSALGLLRWLVWAAPVSALVPLWFWLGRTFHGGGLRVFGVHLASERAALVAVWLAFLAVVVLGSVVGILDARRTARRMIRQGRWEAMGAADGSGEEGDRP